MMKVDFDQSVRLGRTLMTLQRLIPSEVLPMGGKAVLTLWSGGFYWYWFARAAITSTTDYVA